MTTGQRIAAKRKELELSQENLGEKLGVSRQTIYKWEADASLPEVDKLVSLSRLFGVPVGWLLGVEDVPEAAPTEFTEEQMKVIEELLARSRAEAEENAPPQEGEPSQRKRRRWPWAVAVVLLVIVGSSLFSRLNQLENQVNNLSGRISDINWTMSSRIDSMAGRVEDILNAQNSLIARSVTEIDRVDPATNTVTFLVQVTPKTYVEGMEVHILADHGEGVEEIPLSQNEYHLFSGEVTCPLSDDVTLSAVLVDGETRQTQQLNEYVSLYTGSFPGVDLWDHGSLWSVNADKNGLYPLRDISVEASIYTYGGKIGGAVVANIQPGLFQNRKLVAWLEPEDGTPETWGSPGSQERYRFVLPDLDLAAEKGDILIFAALVTDQYGRQYMTLSLPEYQVETDEIVHIGGDYSSADLYNMDYWDFE